MSLFPICGGCNRVAIRVGGCLEPPRLFCDSYRKDHITFPGKCQMKPASESLSSSEPSGLGEANEGYEVSSNKEDSGLRNSRIEPVSQKMVRVNEELTSLTKDIFCGVRRVDIEEGLLEPAIPLFSDYSVVRSLLDLKHAPDFSISKIPDALKALKPYHQSSVCPRISFQTHHTRSSLVYTASVQEFPSQVSPSQISSAEMVCLRNYRWELLQQTQAHNSSMKSTAVSDCERYIASGSEDCTIESWNLHTKICLRNLQGYAQVVFSVAFLGNKVVSESSGPIKIWEEDRCENTLKSHLDRVLSVCVSSCKRLIDSRCHDWTTAVYGSDDGRTLHTLTHSDKGFPEAFLAIDDQVVCECCQVIREIWNTETGEIAIGAYAYSGDVAFVNSLDNLTGSSSEDITGKL